MPSATHNLQIHSGFCGYPAYADSGGYGGGYGGGLTLSYIQK